MQRHNENAVYFFYNRSSVIQFNYPLKHFIIFILRMCLFTCNSSSLGFSLKIKIIRLFDLIKLYNQLYITTSNPIHLISNLVSDKLAIPDSCRQISVRLGKTWIFSGSNAVFRLQWHSNRLRFSPSEYDLLYDFFVFKGNCNNKVTFRNKQWKKSKFNKCRRKISGRPL